MVTMRLTGVSVVKQIIHVYFYLNKKIADGILSPQRSLPPALPPKSPRLIPVPQRRAISGPPCATGGDQLQTKLRRLLNTDSKENVFFPENPPSVVVQSSNGIISRDHQLDKFRYSPGSPSAGCRDDDRALVRIERDANKQNVQFPVFLPSLALSD